MATSYTSLLGFALPVTGELDGTWGTTVNNSITELVEDAIAATATASVASGDWTLSTTGSGATNEARCAIIRPTGSPGVSRNVIAPGQSKAYIVDNQSNASVVFKATATTGVTIAAGKQALVAWNGSDFVQVGASAGGSTTQVQYNSSGSLAGSANLTFDGTTLTANDIIDSSLTASKPVFTNGSKNLVSTGTLGADQGGTGATSLTLNNVILGNGTSAVQFVAPGANGNILTSNGTTWTSATPAATGVSKGQSIAFAMIFGL